MFRFDSRSQVTARVLDKLSRAGLNAGTPGSFIRSLADIFIDEGIRVYEDANFFAQQAFLDTASGPFLDLIGEGIFGLSRIPASSSEASSADSAVEVYVDSGYLYDYLPKSQDGLYAVISEGTKVFTTGGKEFEISEDVTIPPGASSVYVGISASTPGTGSDIPAGVVSTIDLSSQIKIRNVTAVTGGADSETDANYRFRISQAYLSMERANESAIRLALLQIAGVAEVRLENRLHGPGTFEVLLIPEGNRILPSQMVEAQSAISRTAAYTHTAFIREPHYVQFRVDISVEVEPGTDPDSMKPTVEQAVMDYLETIKIGGLLVVDKVLNAVLNLNGVRDAKLINFCLDGAPLTTGQYQLDRRELLTPALDRAETVKVLIT